MASGEKIIEIAGSLAACLREHFPIQGRPAPSSGEPNRHCLLVLLGKCNLLRMALTAGRPDIAGRLGENGSTIRDDAIERLQEVCDRIPREYDFAHIATQDHCALFERGELPEINLKLIQDLEWAAERLADDFGGKESPDTGALPQLSEKSDRK